MKKYVLGVDGGGTKSHLAIFDTDGRRLDFRTWGALNHEVLPEGFARLEQELDLFLRGALNDNGITPETLAYSVFGLAGADTKRQHAIISDILSRLGFKAFTLCNDAYLGVHAACPDGVGICAINGTGCTLAGIGSDGKALQIGGVGGISGDLGGGGRMGEDAVGRVYRELFRSGKPTAMTGLLLELLGVEDKHDFLEALAEKEETGLLRVRDCNRLLFEGARLGDEAALEILGAVAENYAGAIACMVKELHFQKDKPVHIALAGSVFVKGESPALINMLKAAVEKQNTGRFFEYAKLEKPPVAGAVMWALCKAGASREAIGRARDNHYGGGA